MTRSNQPPRNLNEGRENLPLISTKLQTQPHILAFSTALGGNRTNRTETHFSASGATSGMWGIQT